MKRKFVSVQFEKINFGEYNNAKSYQFLTDIMDLRVGDCVVVDTRNGPTVAYVIEYNSHSVLGHDRLKWVIQKVDMSNHNQRLVKEKKLNEIRTKMETRRKEIEEIQLFKLLAQEDKDMEKLLKEYQDLSF